jgi:iron complex outermembrane receptor protein
MLYQLLPSKKVLRDGASAQYGSDATECININVKATNNLISPLRDQNDHRGGNDGNNAQVDMNYGTSLGKEKPTQLQVFIKRQRRAKDATGNSIQCAAEQRPLKWN